MNCTSIRISNRNLSNVSNAISILYNSNVIVSNNELSNIKWDTFYVRYSKNISFYDNIVTNSFRVGQLLESDLNHIFNNKFLNCSYGLTLTYSDNNIIFSNLISKTISQGINLEWSNNNYLHRNILFKINIGIQTYTTNNNLIINNIIINSSSYGIYSYYSYNTISDNEFLNNNPSGLSQGFSTHAQYSGLPIEIIKNNYWNDKTIPDIDSNSIVDNPYFLDCDTGFPIQMDNYPLTSSSSFKPQIIKYPGAGISLNKVSSIEWNPASIFNYTAKYSIYYSPDEGNSWTNLALNVNNTKIFWNTTLVSDGQHYLLKIIADWDFGFAYKIISTEEFAINNSLIPDTTTITETISLSPSTITTTVPTNTTETFFLTSTTLSTMISQIVETLTKTTTGFNITLIAIGFLGILIIRRKRIDC